MCPRRPVTLNPGLDFFMKGKLNPDVMVRPKIKFYLFAIAYLPTLLLPTQLFFLLFHK